MRVLVIGAAGRTGREIVSQALTHGHEVTAFVHDASLGMQDERLRVVNGDVLDFQQVSSAVLGQHAVVSALSHGADRAG